MLVPKPAAIQQHSSDQSPAADGEQPPLPASPRQRCFRLPSEASMTHSPALGSSGGPPALQAAPHPAAGPPFVPYGTQPVLPAQPATPSMTADVSQQHSSYASPFQAAASAHGARCGPLQLCCPFSMRK